MRIVAQELEKLSVDELLSLRDQVTVAIGERAARVRKQLRHLANGRIAQAERRGLTKKSRGRRGRRPGYKLEPKYRDPVSGKTWAGRGMRPAWVKRTHLIKRSG